MITLPILRRMRAGFTKRDYIYFLLWAVVFNGGYPIAVHFIPELKVCSHFALPLFNTYLGILVLGDYIERFVIHARYKFRLAAVIFALYVAALTALTYFEYKINPEDFLFFDDRTSVIVVVMSACFFYAAKYLCRNLNLGESGVRVLAFLGRITFGAFLVSDLFVKVFKPLVFASLCRVTQPLAALAVYDIAVFTASMAAGAVLVNIPLIKKLL